MALNKVQLDRAKSRLKEIYNEKISSFSGKYTEEEKYNLYTQGRFGVSYDPNSWNRYQLWFEGEEDRVRDSKEKLDKIKKIYESALDQLIFGENAEDVLTILKDFQNVEVQ